MSQETITEEKSAPEPAPTLTLADLTAFKQIIEISNSRGAFKPEELQAVGALYQKLSMFLQMAIASSAQAMADSAETGDKVEDPKGN